MALPPTLIFFTFVQVKTTFKNTLHVLLVLITSSVIVILRVFHRFIILYLHLISPTQQLITSVVLIEHSLIQGGNRGGNKEHHQKKSFLYMHYTKSSLIILFHINNHIFIFYQDWLTLSQSLLIVFSKIHLTYCKCSYYDTSMCSQ